MLAIFDLDGTITKRDTFIPFLFFCWRELNLPILRLLELPFYGIFYLSGLLSSAKLKEIFLFKVLSGVPVERASLISESFKTRLVTDGLNGLVISILKSHLKRNDRVILATASFDIYSEAIAKSLGINEVICTRAEIRDGIMTGRIFGENCKGVTKLKLLEERLKDTDWSDSVLYTDHYSDLPLLKRVSQGVLVKPGLRTRWLLRKFGFPSL